MHLDRRLLGWGVFFILVGGIPLAVRANLLDRDLVAQWPLLWPVLLIGGGIGLLLRRTPIDWVGGAVTAITFGIMGGGVLVTGADVLPFASGCTNNDTTLTAFEDRSGTLDGAAQVDVSFNCGSLAISAVDGSAWTLSGSDRDGSGPAVKGTATDVTIEPSDSGGFPASNRSSWNLGLPRASSLALGLTLNAGSGAVNLDGATISSVSMTLNAGKLTLDLGSTAQLGDMSATVNAGSGAVSIPSGERDVNFSLNAGSLELCLPDGAAVLVNWAGTLGSNNFAEAGLVKVDDSTWTSSGYDASQPHTKLHVSANAGSFTLQRGGACDA